MNNITNLVIEGGGFKSFAAIGSIKYFEEFDNYSFVSIKNFAGSSSGSILCFLLVCGFKSDEIKDFIYKNNWNSVIKNNIFHQVYNLILYHGLNSLSSFMKKIENFVSIKGISRNITFIELYEKTGKNLVVTGTNLCKSRIEYFSKDTTPEMNVFDAIQISASIPYIIKSFKYKGDIYCDGSILVNFPLYYFDVQTNGKFCKNNIELDCKKKLENVKENSTLGIWTLEKNKHENNNFYTGSNTINSISSFSYALINTVAINTEKLYIKERFWSRTISIKLTFDTKINDFNPSDDIKQKLFDAGYISAKNYLDL
jgi:predicted acylesterase/phospholipase RssA